MTKCACKIKFHSYSPDEENHAYLEKCHLCKAAPMLLAACEMFQSAKNSMSNKEIFNNLILVSDVMINKAITAATKGQKL